MGIIRLTLIALVGLWAAMLYFGRDEGLPDDRIGRAPAPEPVVVEANETLDTVLSDAPSGEPEPETVFAPAPVAAPEPELAADPVPQASLAAQTEPEPEVTLTEPDPGPAPDPEPAPEPEPEPQSALILYVTGNQVNVRAGPSTVYDVITALSRGNPVEDLGDAGEGWRMILLSNGDVGYMSGTFLSPEAP